MKWFTIIYSMLAYAIVPKNASETALSPTGQWFFAPRRARRRHTSLHHGPRPRQNNLLSTTGGAETNRHDTQAGRRTHTLWAPVFSNAYQTVRVRTWLRSSSCRHCSALPLPVVSIDQDLDTIVWVISIAYNTVRGIQLFIVFTSIDSSNSAHHIGSKRYTKNHVTGT